MVSKLAILKDAQIVQVAFELKAQRSVRFQTGRPWRLFDHDFSRGVHPKAAGKEQVCVQLVWTTCAIRRSCLHKSPRCNTVGQQYCNTVFRGHM